MPGWMDKLKAKAEETLHDPEKMDAIKSKVANAAERRLAGRSRQGGYYGPGANPGAVFIDEGGPDGREYAAEERAQDTGGGGDSESPNASDWNDAGSSDSGGWGDSGSSDSGDGGELSDGGGD